jgi:hypothetical protein
VQRIKKLVFAFRLVNASKFPCQNYATKTKYLRIPLYFGLITFFFVEDFVKTLAHTCIEIFVCEKLRNKQKLVFYIDSY